jgi:hypothetical protein
LIKWLKCIVSREFDISSLLEVWDYLFSGFKPELKPSTHIDQLHFLDYICLALIRYSRTQFLEGDYTECLMRAMKPLELTSAQEIIESAELYRRLLRPQDFPSSPLISLRQRVEDHNKTHHSHINGPLDHAALLDMSFEGSPQKSSLAQSHPDL